MIKTKQELRFFIMADMMMNRGKFKWTLTDRIRQILIPDLMMQYLNSMRYCSYYSGVKSLTISWSLISKLFHALRYKRLGMKLGLTIGSEVFGYGLVIPHYGTIVVGGSNRIGNYAVLHTSTCISDNSKQIGNGLYLATGAKMTSPITLGDNVSVGANSVVNKSFHSDCLIAGAPANMIKEAKAWYIRDGERFTERVRKIEELKTKMNL